jgi:RNA polymerase sigma factor (sigma-70 family)
MLIGNESHDAANGGISGTLVHDDEREPDTAEQNRPNSVRMQGAMPSESNLAPNGTTLHDNPMSNSDLFVTRRIGDEDVVQQFRRLRSDDRYSMRGGDRQSLRDHLVLMHAPLVDHCARAFTASGEPVEDLLQEGSIGLIKAVDRYDPEKGVRFSTYACHLISGEMRHYLRDLGKMIHEPGWHAELRGQVMRAHEDLTQTLGRAPKPEEVASALDVQPNLVRKVLESGNFSRWHRWMPKATSQMARCAPTPTMKPMLRSVRFRHRSKTA